MSTTINTYHEISARYTVLHYYLPLPVIMRWHFRLRRDPHF